MNRQDYSKALRERLNEHYKATPVHPNGAISRQVLALMETLGDAVFGLALDLDRLARAVMPPQETPPEPLVLTEDTPEAGGVTPDQESA